MSQGLGRGALSALLLASTVVALAYGVALPIVPFLLERQLGPGAAVSWHTGLLTGTYSFALFLFAPLWGRLSDRWQRRAVILFGLAGFAMALVVFAFIDSLVTLYLGRFLSGMFAAAVVPVALAMVADWATDGQERARQFAWLNVASILGALAGPALGGMLGSQWNRGLPPSGGPFLLVAATAAAIGLLALLTLPRAGPARDPLTRHPRPGAGTRPLLLLALLAAWGLGTFEVGLALRASELNLGPQDTGLMFVECMLVMVAAQAPVFNRWFPAARTRFLLAPALLVLGLGLLLLSRATGTLNLLVAVAAVAAAAGVLAPVLAFWVSLAAGEVQGGELGRQASATSLGQALGSGAGGLLFGTGGGVAAFVVAAAAVLLGALFALPLSRRLAELVPATACGTAR